MNSNFTTDGIVAPAHPLASLDFLTKPKQPPQHPLSKFIALDGEAQPPRWVIPGFIGQGVVVISGAGGVGKTTALLPLAMTAAGLHGGELMPKEWRHVVYITEDLEQAKRIIAGIVHHSDLGIKLDDLRERLHIVEAVRLDPTYVAAVGKTYREQFTRTVNGVEVLPLVVLDTKSAVLALDNENDNSEASRTMAAMKQDFAGLPLWIVGHIAKTIIGRSDVAALSNRGAGASGDDSNQTLFLVQEDANRYLVLGKTRFEPRWAELEITSYMAQAPGFDEYGNAEDVFMRWGIAAPAQQTRQEASEQATAALQREHESNLRQEVRDAVETAWSIGNPVNRAGVMAQIKRKRQTVSAMIEVLINERWLHEITVPAKDRVTNSRSAFLVSFTTSEHESVLKGNLPPDKLLVPKTWKK